MRMPAHEILRQAATQTNDDAGDGTTTSTVLARAILRESQKFIASGVSPIELQRGIDIAVKEVVSNLMELAQPVTTAADIEHVASISANNDPAIGKLIAMAVDRVGKTAQLLLKSHAR